MKSRIWLTQAVELLVLSAFAVAQPLFEVLGHNATFFVAHRTNATDIVAFAAVLLLLPPVVCFGGVRLISIVSDTTGRVLHVLLLGVLAGLTIAPPVTRSFGLGAASWVLLVCATAALTVRFHGRWRRAGLAISWASVAPAAFATLFFLGSPVRQLVLPASAANVRATVARDVPVVLLVLDELPLSALLRPDGSLNARRFPGIARLAATSTWYPNATTNADTTAHALPALLTGSWLREDRLPTAQAHPNNLLTYWGRTFPLQASEFVTALCARDVCGAPGATHGWQTLLSDATVVYLHATLPAALTKGWLPAIEGRWTSFQNEASVASPPAAQASSEEPESAGDEPARFEGLLEQLEPSAGPRLWYLHFRLPHVPWEYLPTGQSYDGTRVTGLTEDHRWEFDERGVDHGLQRFLLQLQYVDRLLGRLLDRLEETSLDQRALVIVVADHGAAFRVNTSRRYFDATHPADVLRIPLFVRFPGQQHTVIDARNAELVDVLPTIGDVLGMSIPWPMDGQSLRQEGGTRGDKHLFSRFRGLTTVSNASSAGSSQLPERIDALFGAGGDPDDVYRIGPHRHLLGTRAPVPNEEDPRPQQIVLDHPEGFAFVAPGSSVVPALLTATVSDAIAPGTPVAIALNDVIAGLGWVQAGENARRLAVMLAPRFFRPGSNAVSIYRLSPDSRLSLVGHLATRAYQLQSDGADGPVSRIVTPDGAVRQVRTAAYEGYIERHVRNGSSVHLTGWAIDPAHQRAPHAFIIVQGRRVVGTASPLPRLDVSAHFKTPDVTDTGIRTRASALTAGEDVAVYALFSDGAYRLPLPPPQ